MPSWDKVLEEIQSEGARPKESSADTVRRKYLLKLYEHTHRNIIAYYSGWLQSGPVAGIDINDMDMNGFMATIHNLDCSKGLDLILHTPGGSISSAEQIVHYLKSKFGNNIRAIIPQIAMSAGTMISCACKEIVMGKQSCLGPFDPQVNGLSAIRVLEEFTHAISSAKAEPASIPFWQIIIGKYHPTFLNSCSFACQRTEELVKCWLMENMFFDTDSAEDNANNVIKKFTDTGHTQDHDKHITVEECEDAGLKIAHLESDQTLQDLVLTVHHAFMHTLSGGMITKAIENHNGIGLFNFKSN